MQLTINFDLTNTKALALLNYIRTLDFVSFEEDNKLSDIEKKAIDEGLEAIEQGKFVSHKEVMNEMKDRYSNLF